MVGMKDVTRSPHGQFEQDWDDLRAYIKKRNEMNGQIRRLRSLMKAYLDTIPIEEESDD